MMEWLANLSIKWVLVSVGILLLARKALLRSSRQRTDAAVTCEFIDSALIAVVVVFLIIRPYFVQAYFIPSESMHPTLMESDRIVVNKLIYRFRPPRRDEILVFRPPEERVPEGKDYIKRVIGLPGEAVEVVPERLLVDGRTLMRLTRGSASEVMRENYRPEASVGFTYPLQDGGVTIQHGIAIITSGLEEDLRAATYLPGDRIEEEPHAVFLNNRALLAVVFGTITSTTSTRDLTQWGGDPNLVGKVYSANGIPRLFLVQGRELSVDPGHVLIDGRRLVEPYVAEDPAYAMPPTRIPPGHYFMMGDNRNHSFDSHAWGPLPTDHIIGRAELIFWPPGHFRLIHLSRAR